MLKNFLTLFVLAVLSICGSIFVACSDDDDVEYLFDREVSELSVLRLCSDKADSGAYCYQVRFHYPIDTDNLQNIYVWIDSTVVGSEEKSVDGKKLEQADLVVEYKKTESLYDTIDLTGYLQDYVKDKERKQLMIGIYCEYNGGEPGSVQRVYLHFRDDIAPLFAPIESADSFWTTGAMFEWYRPTDQTDYYAPNDLSGPIAGYNIVIYSEDKDEDLRDLKVTVISPQGTDSTGKTIYTRHARFNANNDSVWIGSSDHSDKIKNYLRIAIADGEGYNAEEPEANNFRVIVEGLKSERRYKIASSAYDSSGQNSGNEKFSQLNWPEFSTTDSIAPLMPSRIFVQDDSLFPGMARLDSNNRLYIFWSRSVDPLVSDHGIKADSVLNIPGSCIDKICYDTVASYEVMLFDRAKKEWISYEKAGGTGRFGQFYKFSDGKMNGLDDEDVFELNGLSSFISDTLRWVSPGDTLILRIRSIDKSNYYSKGLIDTIVVSPGKLAKEVSCPEGFVPVKAADTSAVFCMERYEHRNDSGVFMTGVLHSEAVAACEGVSASGFTVSLCKERDWELVCLSGGSLAYGVIEEDASDASDVLFNNCNVATNNSEAAASLATRSTHCKNPAGIHDMPGQYQEWALGRSEDTVAVVKGGSYKNYGGLDLESQALCTNRSFPYYTRLAYTTDTVYLYREGTKVDTVYEADTSRTLYQKLTAKDFKDSLQFFDVQDSSGNSIGTDYVPYAEYKKGGEEWLKSLSNGLIYVPSEVKVVFLTGEKVAYREAAAFYRSPSIGFRCCAYPE